MGQMYAVIMPSIAVSVAQDLIRIAAASSRSIIIHSAVFTQSSDFGDGQAEGLRFLIKRGAAVGSGGTTQTPANLSSIGTASSATARKNDTTAGTGGTDVYEENANVQIGWIYRPTPEERIVISGASSVTFNLPTAPVDPLTMSGVVIFEEIG